MYNVISISFQVAWMLFDKSAILTVQNHVITRNPRISVSHDKHRTWFLHINDVHEEDKGKYMCQINTAAAKTQYGYLHVVVPPNIDDSQSSSDAIVREGANVSLTCKATGSPIPSIRWKRDDGTKISINKTLSVPEWEGETLEMARISRLDMGAYLCIASNGIPPTVSKQIKVSVDFPPMLWIPHQLVGAPLGYSVILECYTEAHPTSLNYWAREDNLMIHESSKYKTVSLPDKPSYKTHMMLTINDIQNNLEQEDRRDHPAFVVDGSTPVVPLRLFVFPSFVRSPYDSNPLGISMLTDQQISPRKLPNFSSLRQESRFRKSFLKRPVTSVLSAPPSTSPSPSTTEVPKKDWEFMAEMNNSVYGNPSSLTIQNEKNIKTGTKFQSNLNEIGKSEQKSSELDRKRNYNWPDKGKGVREASYCLRGLDENREDSRKGRGEQKRMKEMVEEGVIRPTKATAHQVVSDS
ncbi:Lachesin [Cyphomyrmex costatus]|uniref:Lachesin n=1 Tax=Cyphomyrmex costatus TaxID=456900 RepID=A0A195CSA4_9HYME|nr:Lachesin [Cyphomyrmex costatus]